MTYKQGCVPILFVAVAAVAAVAAPPNAIQLRPDALKWGPASESLPTGTHIAVLEGNPRGPGLFTIRLSVPAGARVRPHWHPKDERVTVLEGLVVVGFGDSIEESALAKFGPGSFYVNPANSHHYVIFQEDSVIQITGVGPWEIHFLPEAKPSAPAP